MAEAGGEPQGVAPKLVARWMRLLVATFGAVCVLVVWRNATLTPLRIAGACLMVGGLAIWITAQFQLGDSFSVRPRARKLVTHGIYSRIRNPIYVGSTILIAGLMLFVQKPLFLVILVILIPAQTVRARREARVLEDKFGEEYREYRRKTWF